MTNYKTPIPPVVESYLQEIESGEYRNCRRIDAVARYIRRVFETEDLIFEAARCEKYLSLEKYFPFELFPWEKAQVALWLCTYRKDGFPRWSTLFDFMGRGGGKDGFISFIAFCLISPYNPASGYDVDICANNEYQAQRPLSDLVDMINRSKDKAKLDRFYHTKIESIKGRPLFIYTDGLNEAEDKAQKQFGDDHIFDIMRHTTFENARQMIETLAAEVEKHRNGAEPNDDLTMMCITKK
mgnify:CR=1 FL=1